MILRLRQERHPIFNIKARDDQKVSVMLDTGASVSVCLATEDNLKAWFPDCVKTSLVTSVNSVVHKSTAEIYTIPKLKIGDLEVHNLPLAMIPAPETNFDIIMSSWVLAYNTFAVDYMEHKLGISTSKTNKIYCREIRSETQKDVYVSFCVFLNDTEMADDVLRWCKDNAPDAIKNLTDSEILECMLSSYYMMHK